VILRGAKVVTESSVIDGGDVRVEGGRIAAIGVVADTGAEREPRAEQDVEVVDLADHWVLPGFVDMHIHGGGGGSYATGDQESALRARDFHLGHGTTTTMASMVTAPIDDLCRDIAALGELVEDGTLAGIHLEGPFISVDRCGAHDKAYLREPAPAALRALLAAGRGTVRMATIAPELDGGLAAVRTLVDEGVIAAVGHTDATCAVAGQAFDAGASVATHLFNGMRPVDHREPGPVTAALGREHVTVELINDGTHLHPATLSIVMRSAGQGRVALITDAISAAGLPDGEFVLGSMRVRVRDGAATIAESGVLAGSTVTLDMVLRRALLEDRLSILEVSTMLSGTPARALGLADDIGTLAEGKRADLVVLDRDLQVVGVMLHGEWIRLRSAGGTAIVD
jgi:N-acetylglucosamine-6-phosphate deacetylase